MYGIDWEQVIETERDEINRLRGTDAPHNTNQGEDTMARPKNTDIDRWCDQPWNTLTPTQGRHAIKRAFPRISADQLAQIEHVMTDNPSHSINEYANVVNTAVLTKTTAADTTPEPTPDRPLTASSWERGMVLDELPDQVTHAHPIPGQELAAKALANPGRWVIVAVYGAGDGARSVENRRKAAASVARAINRGQRVAFRPAGAYEAQLVEPAAKPGTYLVAVKARETRA
ncbi:hypothetical protein [Bifidobacterium cuniculi]|uniref:Uncharacterized protein n=1 Tax=Bifidobacterium cuniculi TaxID=1688 RepID=A0A087B4H1_9BIFI|nr:hypothetical protein [Bifidobacterium cuniculi]KFI65921.1 hypothetical protein BCUN_0420 [Bifidobacterium cuniculi]